MPVIRFPKIDEFPSLSVMRANAQDFLRHRKLPLLRYGISMRTSLDALHLERYDFSTQSPLLVTAQGNVRLEPSMDDHEDDATNKGSPGMVDENTQYFDALIKATCSQAITIVVPQGSVDGKVSITIPATTKSFCLLVVAEENSSADIIIASKNTDADLLSCVDIKTVVKKNATVRIVNTISRRDGVIIWKRSSQVDQQGTMRWYDASFGLRVSLVDTRNFLVGDSASVHTVALAVRSQNQTADHYNGTYHHAPNTASDLKVKGIVDGSAKILERGLVKIFEHGFNADGYQQADMVVLDERASANALPQLEINNNDVRCSHGATIGRIDDAQLFYLQSRGLSRHDAQQAVIQGFISSIVELFPTASLREFLYTTTASSLEHSAVSSESNKKQQADELRLEASP